MPMPWLPSRRRAPAASHQPAGTDQGARACPFDLMGTGLPGWTSSRLSRHFPKQHFHFHFYAEKHSNINTAKDYSRLRPFPFLYHMGYLSINMNQIITVSKNLT
jgi:hypothetical protein